MDVRRTDESDGGVIHSSFTYDIYLYNNLGCKGKGKREKGKHASVPDLLSALLTINFMLYTGVKRLPIDGIPSFLHFIRRHKALATW